MKKRQVKKSMDLRNKYQKKYEYYIILNCNLEKWMNLNYYKNVCLSLIKFQEYIISRNKRKNLTKYRK